VPSFGGTTVVEALTVLPILGARFSYLPKEFQREQASPR
jgi:hypothetical protein